MYIQVVTVDGKQKTVLNVSKLTKIKELKEEIEEEFSIEKSKQALFFSGKHLEDDGTLYDYSVNLNNVIQVMIKSVKPKSPKKENKKINQNSKENTADNDNDEIPVESLYYKVGDAVDCSDITMGTWFEAMIIKIYQKSDKKLYRVQWDLPDCKDEFFEVEEERIRPRAWKVLKFDDLKPGLKVMLNYNLEEPKEVGNWYDFTISEIISSRTSKQLVGTLHIGDDSSRSVENCTVPINSDIFAIEEAVLLENRDDNLIAKRIPSKKRITPVKCSHCKDNPKKLCRECSCRKCGHKSDPHLQLLCDECNDAFHLKCLNPPLKELPSDDYWYCPDCKRDDSEIIKVGEKAKPKKNQSKVVGTNKDWGKGFACVGRTKTCTIVDSNHKGPIPGIDVGTSWKFRIQVSEAGVHRPPVSGIHGRECECAYSIALSGGYEDDVDNGEEFLYTGAGGRDLSGNKRTAKQGFDQTLTATNKALALNCNAPFNDIKGAEAKDWRKGSPIRVVRNFKLRKHSKYAPEDGNRYDGIYKVVKYWPEKGQGGFIVWRYLMRRDDPAPAPWTEEGKKRIAKLGLEMIYPDGYHEAQEKKIKTERKSLTGQKRKSVDEAVNKNNNTKHVNKKIKTAYTLSDEVENLINLDEENDKTWILCNKSLSEGKQAYLEKVTTEFTCVICQDLVLKPVTTPCLHNICLSCLKRSFALEAYECPMCRTKLGSNFEMNINEKLSKILVTLFPGYDKRR